MNNDWTVRYQAGGHSSILSVDARLFIKSFNKVFTIELFYEKDLDGRISLTNGSVLEFLYNDPARVPEICEMVRGIDFVELHIYYADKESDKTSLCEKAAIIYADIDYIGEYIEKYVPYMHNRWRNNYDDRTVPIYNSDFDLNRVKYVAFHDFIPNNIGNYRFKYVHLNGVVDTNEILKINTDILDINTGINHIQDDWHRLLEKVEYLKIEANDRVVDIPLELTCDRLLAYDISDFSGNRKTWKALDAICESHRRRYCKTKSARS